MRLLTRSFVAATLLLLPSLAFAATLSIFPESIALHTGDSVTFYVQVQSKDSINTIGTAVILPPNLSFLSAHDGKVLTQWIERPSYHAAEKSVSFSGIVPDGWSGSDTLASIKVAALADGVYSLTYDPSQTEVYKNDGLATPEPVVFGTLTTKIFSARLLTGVLLLLLLYLSCIALRRRYKVTFV